MKVLILSCTTGEGHNSCAKAIKEAFDLNNDYCEVSDSLSYISKTLSKIVATGHIILYRHYPKLFNFGYRYSEEHPSTFAPGSLIYKIFSRGSKHLRDHIISGEFDTVICTHPFAAVILTEMQNHYSLPILTACVATDYTCSPSNSESNLNYYFIPDVCLIDAFACDNISSDRIIPVGIPIKQNFYIKTDERIAKEDLGISPEKKHVVMMCGSMGCGPLAKLAVNFARTLPDCEFSVICGTNKKLYKSLTKKSQGFDNLHILGFVKDMSKVLDSADLYLTKPGGLSTSEAVAKEVPMLFVNTVAACETYNLKHFLSYKVADSGKNIKELTNKCAEIVTNDSILRSFKNNLLNIPKTNTAMHIREILIEKQKQKK